jgi:hypothetical protein
VPICSYAELSAEPIVGGARRSEQNAVASFVLAMVGVALFLFGPSLLSTLLWIPGTLLVLGHKGKSQIDRSEGRQGGRELANVAIVLGWSGAAFLALVITLFFVGSV